MLTIALIVLSLLAGLVLAVWIASGRREVPFLDSDGFPQREPKLGGDLTRIGRAFR